MPIRLGGMVSGMDTDSIVKELMTAQKSKKKKITDKQTKLEWQQEKWKELNSKLYKLYTEDIFNMKSQGSYLTKKVTSSDESKVTVEGGIDAPLGAHKVEVNSLASAQILTSGALADSVKSSSKLTDVVAGVQAGTMIRIQAGKDGAADTKVLNLNVTNNTTIGDFVDALKEAGLNASFDEKQHRFFISSKNTGEDNVFSIQTVTMNSNASAALDDLKASNALDYSSLSSENQAKVDTILNSVVNASGVNVNQLIQNVFSIPETGSVPSDAVEKDIYDKLKELKTIVTNNTTANAQKNHSSNIDTNLLDGSGSGSYTVNGTTYNYATEQGKVSSQVTNELVALYPGDSADILAGTVTNPDILAKQKELTNSYIKTNVLADIADKDLTAAIPNISNSFGLYVTEMQNAAPPAGTSILDGLNIGEVNANNLAANTKSAIEAASDSEIKYNGAILKGNTNTIEANGLKFNLKGETTGEVALKVAANTDEVYDRVKSFVKNYNAILKEMNELYYADRAKGYDVLSEEEEQAMSDKQVEKWNDKIKSALFRRDDTLGSLTSAMRSALMSNVEVDGKSYSFSSFGIETSIDYTEKGLLHIYGDKEDSTYASENDKLRAAIEKDPELVMKVMTGVSQNLYDVMSEKFKAIPNVKSANCIYNDKEMNNRLDDYKKQVKEMEKKLTDMENKYYKQFAAMETALSKLQSQGNALNSMLGIGGQ